MRPSIIAFEIVFYQFLIKIIKMDKITTYTIVLTAEQADELHRYLKENGFEFSQRPYTRFFASRPGLSIAVYENLKLVVQGKDAGEFVEFTLEPIILKQARLGYESLFDSNYYLPRIGVDESGKGDYFGPLCVAGVYVNEEIIKMWQTAGIRDSKTIKSDSTIKKLAETIRKTANCLTEVVVIGNEAYNELYEKVGNLNRILAWGHSRVIENLLLKQSRLKPPPRFVICDQFANTKDVIEESLMKFGQKIKVVQRHKAESDIAVAAASIIARNEFITRTEKMKKEYKLDFPRGNSSQVKDVAREFVKMYGVDKLKKVAKLHFKTTKQILEPNNENLEPGQE